MHQRGKTAQAIVGAVALLASLAGCGNKTLFVEAPGFDAGLGEVDAGLSSDQSCGSGRVACEAGQHCVAGLCVATKIQHVVLIVQENHTFDSIFGAYCEKPAGSNPSCTKGRSCCEAAPLTDARGTPPLVLDDAQNLGGGDPNHFTPCELQQIDNGAMDNFTAGSSVGATVCTSACSRRENFVVADSETARDYWAYADNNALADRYFQPIVGGSSSNNMYFAVAHVQFIDNAVVPRATGLGCQDPTGLCIDGTITSYSGRTTIVELLAQVGRTFAVYGDGYAEAVAAGSDGCASPPDYCPYNHLHPIARQSCLYDPADIPFQYYSQLADFPQYMRDYDDLARDVANQRLPGFSFVKGRTYRNDHPVFSRLSGGAQFVRQTVETVLQSAYGDDTLVLVTWDEGGGFYDHVPPASSVDTDEQGVPVPRGTRVPLIAIGRFARKGTVSHVVLDHSSIVRFLEYNFIGPTGQLNAADARVNNLGSLLDPATTGVQVP